MMTKQAMSPHEVAAAQKLVASPERDQAAEAVNRGLVAGTRTFSVSRLGPNDIVRELVAAEFRGRGWKVSVHPDQRDGDYYRFA